MAHALLTTAVSFAQDIETLVMPGAVIEGHAELEPECSSCHAMFQRNAQRQLCMDCHEDVAKDIDDAEGFHGLHPDARGDQCASCHTDHEGRDANVVMLVEDEFDHSFTDFEITGAHEEAECDNCHASTEKHRDAPSDCAACHKEDAPHGESMGDDCADCHQTTEWPDADFDHDTTDYPLIGKHQEAACLDCHEDRTFQNPPTTCYGCHAEDDAHDGRSGQQCENCHNPSDWHDSSFDHTRDTDFTLEGTHAELTCNDCHSEDPFQDEMDMQCASCHIEDDAHDKHRGDKCDTCHISTQWEEPIFDHDRDTDYGLLGAHQEIACNDCHVEPIYEVELMTTCESCHLDDDPHEGSLGAQCENCHTEVNWQDPVFFDHDLTQFPLLGKHTENDCEDCHKTQAFSNTNSACVECHQEDDPHRGNFPDRCNACHNPLGWDAWLFDHAVQTDFPLEGAHVSVACDDCHRMPLDKIKSIDGNCGTCHRADDIHDGEFGADCGRCHIAETFREVRSLQ